MILLVAVPFGSWRLERLDAGAAASTAAEHERVEGIVVIAPRRFGDGSMFVAETESGRIAVRSPPGAASVATGDHVLISGRVEPAADWIAGYLRRLGTRAWIVARRVRSLGPARRGLVGDLDAVRRRATAAIDEAMPAREAALMRGFVLGDDSEIDPFTAESFKRSGLSHLLAVSGQNVVLLLAFTVAILIAFGVPRRARWPLLAAAVAIYVPVAGAGPSIQRAGLMGLTGLLAAWLERPFDRWWALYLAAVATLAWNPLSVADPGWQLSFAAVAGIAALAQPLAAKLRSRLGASRGGGLRAALAEGAAITLAATIATAPLIAHHFEVVSLAGLPANLLALPAVAPAMWSGMALAFAGQLPGLPLEPLGWLAAVFAGYIEWVAATLAEPGWAQVDLALGSWWSVLAAYALLAALAICTPTVAKRLRLAAERPSRVHFPGSEGRSAVLLALAVVLGGLAAVVGVAGGGGGSSALGNWRFETRFLDVGQGDSILLRERDGAAVLIDTGYAGTGADERLRELGVDRLDALILTHEDLDHAGNLEGIAATLPISTVFTNGFDHKLSRRIHALGLRERVVAAGARLRFGRITFGVLWPPPGFSAPADEPNVAGIVVLAAWRGFSELLTADAEAEAAPYPAPDVDVLKLPHHGSDDSALDTLLERSAPELAVVSVGADNGYGHPTAASLGSAAAVGVPLLRTDADGEVRITVTRRAWSAG